jgi:hypothetical protein
MWWRRMEKISWTDSVRTEKNKVKEKINILQTIKIRNTNCIGNILCRNCVLKHVTEGNIEGAI